MGNHNFPTTNNSPWRKQFVLAVGVSALLGVGFGGSAMAAPETSTSNAVMAPPQSQVLRGVVVDQKGEPVIGASVVIKGTRKGDATDVDGKFTLNASSNATLEVTCVGYLSKTVSVAGKKNIRIVLDEDTKSLSEVVVIGYGSVKKADLAGSVAVMDNNAFKDQPITQASQALQGRVAGVQVENSAAPGGQVKIRVRGASSINRSNDPLYVVDGIVRESGLTGINPEDIQSMQVLKDASSTAIYGSRGSNGVILITTKTGRVNQSTITLDASLGWSSVYKKYKELSAYEYASAYEDIMAAPNTFTDAQMEAYKNGSAGIDWQDELFRTGLTQNYKLAISDGNEKTQYFISGNYVDNMGTVKGSDNKRYQARANLTSDVKPWMHVTFDVNASHNTTKGPNTSATKGNIIWSALNFSPPPWR